MVEQGKWCFIFMLDYLTCGVLDDSLVTVRRFTFGVVVN